MTTAASIPAARPAPIDEGTKPDVPVPRVLLAFLAALAFVVLTRWPVARTEPFEADEFGFLRTIEQYRVPMHHTLFLAGARVLGQAAGDPYRGFVVLDVLVSALALTSAWWWLRALVRPTAAAAATLVLAVAPVFWSYGALAGNYTAIPLVGTFLLGVALRTRRDPRRWHPFAAAAVLALGTGYRQDIGTFWLPVFAVILWRHRWPAAVLALALFTALNVAWLAAMLHDVGGWSAYRAASARFAHSAGYLNSAWHLGLVDAPARYALKAVMALAWTLGPGLAFVPRGAWRLRRVPEGRFLGVVLALSVIPALLFHLLIHFGVPGYAFHYVPALLALMALGIGRAPTAARGDASVPRLLALAACLAALFWFYPTDYERPGFRGSFDLAFARHTRIGLRTRPPSRSPDYWRTANSRR